MNVLTGDETGLLKLVSIKEKTVARYSPLTSGDANAPTIVQSRTLGIKGLSWLGGASLTPYTLLIRILVVHLRGGGPRLRIAAHPFALFVPPYCRHSPLTRSHYIPSHTFSLTQAAWTRATIRASAACGVTGS
jgi:hypothetical protein